MTSHSLQASSHSLQAPFVSGAPGPPGSYRPAGYLIKEEEEEEEMFYSAPGRGEPDDLGDLMQEMREGAAWVEGLAMDCELPSGSSPFGSSPSATPLPPPPPSRLGMCAADVPGSAAPPSADAGPSPFPLPEFAQKQPAEQQQHAAAAAAAQREAEEQEAPLQPSMAAKLMHPGAARGGRLGGAASGALPLTQSGHMIPVSLPGVGCEGESEPQPLPAMAGGAGLGAPPPRAPQQGSWLPPPLPYHCCPGASPSPQPPGAAAAATMQAAAFYGQQPPQQPQARPGASPSLAGFQTAPPAFFHQQQGMAHLVPQDAAGYDMAQLLSGVPQGASFQVPAMLMTVPQPNSSGGGSGDGSDGTKVRMRSSFDGNSGNDSGSGGRGGCGGTAAADAGGAAGGRGPRPSASGGAAGGGGSYCDAPSESSDVEDNSSMACQHSGAQVVPDCGFLPSGPFGMIMPPMGMPAGCLPDGSAFAGFPPMPAPSAFYGADSPAAQTARLARQRSLERYRQKKARRGFGKKIRYQARKVNADKRPRVKGRFVKADEGAAILAAAAASAGAVPTGEPSICSD